MDFVHLHVHAQKSLMDGYSSEAEYVAAAKEIGHTAIALTDHGTLSGHRDMQREARAGGLKPILGLEAYLSPTDRFDRRSVAKRDDNTQIYNHLVILAKDQAGLKNLNKLSEIAWREGYYFKPRIDKEILTEYGEGLIILSGCLNGVISKAIESNNEEEARQWIEYFQKRFGEDFYIEIQPDNPVEINAGLLKYADEYGIKPVVTADCHFAREQDRAAEEIMLILSTSPKEDKEYPYEVNKKYKNIFERLNKIYPERPISFERLDLYIRTRESMSVTLRNQGIDREDAFDATLEIAGKVGEYDYPEGLELLPKPRGNDPDAMLERKAWDGLRKRGLDKNPEYRTRLEEELQIVKDKKFPSYFLIEADIVDWARKQDIMVGPGRGSAAGSLLCFALGITEVDPIKYGLLFFRFINPERNDFPDIDTDFEDRGRGKVKEYFRKKFKHVASISTYSYFSEKGVVRDAARVFRVPMGDVNKAMKQVHSFEDFETSSNVKWFRDQYPEVVEYARKLRGRVRSTGLHAAGIVVAKEPIDNFAPIETRKDPSEPDTAPRIPVIALEMNAVADIGLIKYDFLGLKTLTVLHDTLNLIKERHGKEIDLLGLDLADPAVYADISNGHTVGVFQCEQPAYTNLVKDMGIDNFEDLAASNALVRPGAKNTVGESYIARKQGREQARFAHDLIEPFTRNTYGTIIYQEQVMLAMTELAGMSMATADKVRKIIGKKKDVREFEQYKVEFIEGASKNVSTAVAEALWHDFEAHAGYSFNRSHAVAYSMISYWTAWLKHYYPLEYMCALLMNENDKDARTVYLIETKRLGIKVLLPHINKSQLNFSIEEGAIRFGLIGVKFISDNVGKNIIQNRPFESFRHVWEVAETKGSGINSRMIGALDKVGGATFTDNPKRGDESNYFYEYLNIPKFGTHHFPTYTNDLIRPLDEYDEKETFVVKAMVKKIKKGTGWSRVEVVDETGTAGIFHNENTQIEPGQLYFILVSNNRIVRYVTMDDVYAALSNGTEDGFIGYLIEENLYATPGFYYIVAFVPRKTKAGKMMADIVIANHEREMRSVVAFASNFNLAYGKVREGTVQSLVLQRTKDGSLMFGGLNG